MSVLDPNAAGVSVSLEGNKKKKKSVVWRAVSGAVHKICLVSASAEPREISGLQ